jgi:hypothetical protein
MATSDNPKYASFASSFICWRLLAALNHFIKSVPCCFQAFVHITVELGANKGVSLFAHNEIHIEHLTLSNLNPMVEVKLLKYFLAKIGSVHHCVAS